MDYCWVSLTFDFNKHNNRANVYNVTSHICGKVSDVCQWPGGIVMVMIGKCSSVSAAGSTTIATLATLWQLWPLATAGNQSVPGWSPVSLRYEVETMDTVSAGTRRTNAGTWHSSSVHITSMEYQNHSCPHIIFRNGKIDPKQMLMLVWIYYRRGCFCKICCKQHPDL